ncbi:MAG TPA: hypothetical protein DDW43_04185 [Nitrosomonas sp.]|nr:hypothetical protein [Nitrosomonas sp.]
MGVQPWTLRNCLQHALAIDYVLHPNIMLNTACYHYQQKDIVAGPDSSRLAKLIAPQLHGWFLGTI